MKKLFKILCCSLVLISSVVSVVGCSCSKRPLNVRFNVTLSYSNPENFEMLDIDVKTSIMKKFREPSNTPCYEKVENEYKLIQNAGDVLSCYDKDGNKFEKATHEYVEKTDLERPVYPFTKSYNPITSTNPNPSYTSSVFEVPENKNHSIVYEIEIRNYETVDVYVQEIDIKDVVGDLINEESVEKIKIVYPNTSTHVDGDNEFYKISGRTTMDIVSGKVPSIKFEIHLKGLVIGDTVKGDKEVTLNVPLVVKK